MPGSVKSALHLKCKSSDVWGCCPVGRAPAGRAQSPGSIPGTRQTNCGGTCLSCVPSPQRVETGASKVLGHPWLQSESDTKLGYRRLYLSRKKGFINMSVWLVLGPFLIQDGYEGKISNPNKHRSQINTGRPSEAKANGTTGETADGPPGPRAQPKFSSK